MEKCPYILLKLVAFAILLVPLSGNAMADSDVEPTKIPYKFLSEKDELKLHIFPASGEAPEGGRPAIVFFFGGGWVGGEPNQFYPQCEHLAKRGMVAIAAEYRVKSRNDSTVTQSVADGKSAIRYVRAHAAELGVNPDKIISAGGSAGGHVAACTGTLAAYDEPGEDMTVSSRPNAMILLNPVIDTTLGGYTGRMLPKEGDKSLSPVHHVTKETPPTLICHGKADKTVPFANAIAFQKAMVAAGNHYVLDAYDDAGHGFFNPGRDGGKYYEAIVATIDAFIDSLGW